MALKDILIKPFYNKADDDIAKDFYCPCMANSNRYDRATGYFGSTVYILSWSCLKAFVNHGGKMRIICSPYLATNDQEAINEGLEAKNSETKKEELFKEFLQIFGKETLSAPERVLACLISMGVIEIKIAVGRYDSNRLFHDKVGIFYDDNDAVAFRGSINETFKGISDDGNFESLDAFTSWGDGNDIKRLESIKNDFEEIWNNRKDKIETFELSDSIKSIIREKAKLVSRWTEALDEVTVSIDRAKYWSADKRPNGKKPRQHQLNALESWDNNGRRGILEHATGSGKTFTAMCAIRKELELYHPVVILVPSVALLTQWQREMMETFNDNEINYLLCGGMNALWKKRTILKSFTSPLISNKKRVTIAVTNTATSDEFLKKLYQSDKLMVVADEVHRMGSPENRNFFQVRSGARLGLSATPRRYGDPEGTQAIINYFGDIIQPPYTLKNAIDDGVLCGYFYQPRTVNLTAQEQKDWDDISATIAKEYARSAASNGEERALDSPRVKKLLLKRSRIIKNAENKVSLAEEILTNYYQDGDRWIVYCDNQDQMRKVLNRLNKSKIRAYEYHSALDEAERQSTLKTFENFGGVVVSIRCLDEGVDIPNTTHALILASSQNPREFIQRRGRILRKSKNKNFAYLYDAIVLPQGFETTDKQDHIVETELARAIQFGEWASDPACIVELRMIARKYNIDINNLLEIGTENG